MALNTNRISKGTVINTVYEFPTRARNKLQIRKIIANTIRPVPVNA